MSKTTTNLLVVLIFLSLVLQPSGSVQAATCRVLPYNMGYAPELFGTAHLTMQNCGGVVTGTARNSWVTFTLRGTLSAGVITGTFHQTAGPRVWDRHTPTGPNWYNPQIPFTMVRNGGEFQGYIFFRGHNRKYCGGDGYIPSACMYKG